MQTIPLNFSSTNSLGDKTLPCFVLPEDHQNGKSNKNCSSGLNFKYNGKELQTEEGLDWYDYGWRNYNPSIGRWMNMDALSEEYLEHTPYNYTMSNPVRFTDVAGLYSTDEWMRDNGITQDDLTEVYNASDNENCCGGIGETIKAGVMSMFGFADGDDINTVAENNPEMAAQISNQNAEGARKRNMLAQSVADGLQTGDLLGVSTLVAGLQNGVSGEDAFNLATTIPLFRGLKLLKGSKAVGLGVTSVYQGFDKAGLVRYVGITSRNPGTRFAEHLSSFGTGKEFLRYEVVRGATNINRTGARVFEQQLINRYGLSNNGGQLLNKINSVAPKYWGQYGIK